MSGKPLSVAGIKRNWSGRYKPPTLPDVPSLHESELVQAIINNLQFFLLELGKGFSFVARQKHIRHDGQPFSQNMEPAAGKV